MNQMGNMILSSWVFVHSSFLVKQIISVQLKNFQHYWNGDIVYIQKEQA